MAVPFFLLAQLARMGGNAINNSVTPNEYGVYDNDFQAALGGGGLLPVNGENFSNGIALMDEGKTLEGLASFIPGVGSTYGAIELNKLNKIKAEKAANDKHVTHSTFGDLSQAGRISGVGGGFNTTYTDKSPFDVRDTLDFTGAVDTGISAAGMFGGGGTKPKAKNGIFVDGNNPKELSGITVEGKYINDWDYRKALQLYQDSLALYNKGEHISRRLSEYSNTHGWMSVSDAKEQGIKSAFPLGYTYKESDGGNNFINPDIKPIRTRVYSDPDFLLNSNVDPSNLPYGTYLTSAPLYKKPTHKPVAPRAIRMEAINPALNEIQPIDTRNNTSNIPTVSSVKRAQLSKGRTGSGSLQRDVYSINEDGNVSSLTKEGFDELMNSGFYDERGKLKLQQGGFIDGEGKNGIVGPTDNTTTQYVPDDELSDEELIKVLTKGSPDYPIDYVEESKRQDKISGFPQSGQINIDNTFDPILMGTGVGVGMKMGQRFLPALADELTMGGRSLVKGGINLIKGARKVNPTTINKTFSNVDDVPDDLYQQIYKLSEKDVKNVTTAANKELDNYFELLSSPEGIKRIKQYDDYYGSDMISRLDRVQMKKKFQGISGRDAVVGMNLGKSNTLNKVPQGQWSPLPKDMEIAEFMSRQDPKFPKVRRNSNPETNIGEIQFDVRNAVFAKDLKRTIPHEGKHMLMHGPDLIPAKFTDDIVEIIDFKYLDDVNQQAINTSKGFDEYHGKPLGVKSRNSLVNESINKGVAKMTIRDASYVTSSHEFDAFINTNFRNDLVESGIMKNSFDELTMDKLKSAKGIVNNNARYSQIFSLIPDNKMNDFVKLFNRSIPILGGVGVGVNEATKDKPSFREGGFVQGGISSIKPINGPQHEQGGVDRVLNGVPVEVEGGEFEFSFTDGSKAILNKEQMQMYKSGVSINQIISTMPKDNVIAENGIYLDGDQKRFPERDLSFEELMAQHQQTGLSADTLYKINDPINPTLNAYNKNRTDKLSEFPTKEWLALHKTGSPLSIKEIDSLSRADLRVLRESSNIAYYITRDGATVNLFDPSIGYGGLGRADKGFDSQFNMRNIGIEFGARAGAQGQNLEDLTPEQQVSGNRLIGQVKDDFNIDPNAVVDHGLYNELKGQSDHVDYFNDADKAALGVPTTDKTKQVFAGYDPNNPNWYKDQTFGTNLLAGLYPGIQTPTSTSAVPTPGIVNDPVQQQEAIVSANSGYQLPQSIQPNIFAVNDPNRAIPSTRNSTVGISTRPTQEQALASNLISPINIPNDSPFNIGDDTLDSSYNKQTPLAMKDKNKTRELPYTFGQSTDYPGKGFNFGINSTAQPVNPTLDMTGFKSNVLANQEDGDKTFPPNRFDQYNQNLLYSTLANLGNNISTGIGIGNDIRRNRKEPYSEPISGISTSPITFRSTDVDPYIKRLERSLNTANKVARQSGNPEQVGTNLSRFLDAGENIVEGVNKQNLEGQTSTNRLNVENKARVDSANLGVAQFNKQQRATEEARRDAAYAFNKQQLSNTFQSGINIAGQYGQNKLSSGIMSDLYDQLGPTAFYKMIANG